MTDRAFIAQLDGYGLTTAEICYYLPDHPSLLQLFAWQEYDAAPDFPVLFDFLDHWRREIEAEIQSVRIAHDKLIGPAEWRSVDEVISWKE
ncbi:usg protein [Aurantiacibacter odishensis]|uniref:usg protein n=1 Tax=Aurantiacibacter odishensis TaxID=1155476 RepID=UPI000E7147DF|nr:usg protein [Aurantiacibacter odishensis]